MDPVAAALVAYAVATCGAVRVDVDWTGVATGVVSDGATLSLDGDACRSRPRLRLTEVQGGVVVATYALRPGLTVWVDAPVAAADVAAGAAGQTVPGVVPVDALVGEPVAGPFVARVPVRAGAPVTSAVIAVPVDGSVGQTVDVVVRRGGLVIVTPGRLLQDGRVGDDVRVAIGATGVAETAVLVAPGRVEVR